MTAHLLPVSGQKHADDGKPAATSLTAGRRDLMRALLAGAFMRGTSTPAPSTAPATTPARAPLPPADLWLAAAEGSFLPARLWRETGARRGIMLALHGFTDSRDAWALPAPVFAANGYRVIAPDQRGFGASANRGQWPGQAAMIADTQTMLTGLRHQYPGEKLILMGESMGGAVAILTAAATAHAADFYIFLSPAVWGFDEMDPPTRSLLTLANWLAPTWVPPSRALPADWIPTDNNAALRAMAADPLTLKNIPVSFLYGLTELMSAATAQCGAVTAPALVLTGAHDRLVPANAMLNAWRHFPPKLRRAYYLNGYHLLLRDRARALPTGDVLAWLEAPDSWLPSGADFAAAAWTATHN
jgi:alpha-beta hydrolase superfamily lysophospholipase